MEAGGFEVEEPDPSNNQGLPLGGKGIPYYDNILRSILYVLQEDHGIMDVNLHQFQHHGKRCRYDHLTPDVSPIEMINYGTQSKNRYEGSQRFKHQNPIRITVRIKHIDFT